MVQGVGSDEGFEEGTVDSVFSFHGGENEDADGELVDGSGPALGDMKESFYDFFGE